MKTFTLLIVMVFSIAAYAQNKKPIPSPKILIKIDFINTKDNFSEVETFLHRHPKFGLNVMQLKKIISEENISALAKEIEKASEKSIIIEVSFKKIFSYYSGAVDIRHGKKKYMVNIEQSYTSFYDASSLLTLDFEKKLETELNTILSLAKAEEMNFEEKEKAKKEISEGLKNL